MLDGVPICFLLLMIRLPLNDGGEFECYKDTNSELELKKRKITHNTTIIFRSVFEIKR